MRKILYISGTRADYGPARSILKAIDASPELELYILVTGMHLDPTHGNTWHEIENDGFNIIERVHKKAKGDSLNTMVASIGDYLVGISQTIERLNPNITLVLGDRGEMLAGAMAAAFQNITVVHLCGGSISGSIDDSIRHAITKFSHYHLPASDEQAKRIAQMGESPENIFIVGLPGGDIRPDIALSRETICANYSLPIDQPYLLIIQHSVTHSQDQVRKQIVEILEAVVSANYPTLLAYPNDDAGGRVILEELISYTKRYEHIQLLPTPRSRELFASIMAHAGALVGNSSSGTVEAMSVRLPVVNIGDRQRGRESQSYMINVDYDRDAILKAIEVALHDKDYRQGLAKYISPLISVDTPAKVVEVLCTLDINTANKPKPFINIAVDTN